MRWWRNGAYDALVVFYSAYNHAISLEGDVTLQKQYVIINWDTVNVLFSPSHSTGQPSGERTGASFSKANA